MKADTFQVCFKMRAQYRLIIFADLQQEGQTGTITLKAIDTNSDEPEDACDDPEIVKLMVGYFYQMDYLHDDNTVAAPAVIEVPNSPPPKKKAKRSAPAKRTRASTSAPTPAALPPGPKVHLIEHAKVFAMAVKYHVDALRNLAAQKFKAEVAEHWDHEDLAHAIHVIYTSTADEVTQLREIAVEALDAHRGQLLEKPEIATLLRSITGLACDLLLRDSSIANGLRSATTTSDQLVMCCNLPVEHRRRYGLECPSCGCNLQFCKGCEGFDLDCAACGAAL